MNEVASPCCGSCAWYCWNGRLLKYNCHNPEVVEGGMSEDVVERVRCVIAENFGDTGAIEPNDIHELMDELTRCRAENKELNALFGLQHTRTQKAEHLWRKATNNPNTIPDLGILLEWLMGEMNHG